MLEREKSSFHGVRGGMLCDEMGLGKTLSLLCLVAVDIMKREKSSKKYPPTLIICPLTLLTVWKDEISRHFKEKSVKYELFHRNDGRKTTWKDLLRKDILLTTYDTLHTPLRAIDKKKRIHI